MFDKLPLKALKDIIREYKLTTHIQMARLVDGKRKAYTKQELASELHKHLEIKDDGEIVYKQYPSMTVRYKQEEKKPRTKKTAEDKIKAISEEMKALSAEKRKVIEQEVSKLIDPRVTGKEKITQQEDARREVLSYPEIKKYDADIRELFKKQQKALQAIKASEE
jgi:hypothetical protein